MYDIQKAGPTGSGHFFAFLKKDRGYLPPLHCNLSQQFKLKVKRKFCILGPTCEEWNYDGTDITWYIHGMPRYGKKKIL